MAQSSWAHMFANMYLNFCMHTCICVCIYIKTYLLFIKKNAKNIPTIYHISFAVYGFMFFLDDCKSYKKRAESMIPKWFIPVPMPTSNPPTMENCWSTCGGVTILGTPPQVMIPLTRASKDQPATAYPPIFTAGLKFPYINSWGQRVKKYIQQSLQADPPQ